jgi:hypothetical protein
MFLTALILAMISVNATYGVLHYWSGQTSDDWSVLTNWTEQTAITPVPPAAAASLPGSADEAVIDFQQVVATYDAPFNPVIDSADNLTIDRLTVRKFGTISMTGGTLNMVGASGRWRIGWRASDNSYMEVTGGTINTAYTLEIAENGTGGLAKGELKFSNATAVIGRGITLGDVGTTAAGTGSTAIFTMNSGSFTTGNLGSYGMTVFENGRMNMNGGMLTLKDGLVVNADTLDTTIHGVINLAGGTIQGAVSLTLNGTGAANIDITGGKLILTGDLRDTIQTAVDNGRITGNGILGGYEVGMPDPAGDLRWYYDGTNTSMWAVPEPATLTLIGLGGLFLIRKKR